VVGGSASAKLKIIRASEHLKAIKRCIRTYVRSKSYEIVTDSNGKETLHITKVPPDPIAILAGEMIHQLRSSLDHLAFDLVKANQTNIALSPKWGERCCFPMWVKTPKTPPVYNCNCFDVLPGITKAAFTFIESVQPYNRGDCASALRSLAVLSNIDKHRHLNVTVTNIVTREVLRTAQGRIGLSRSGLKHGAEIKHVLPQPQPTVDVKISIAAYVTFDEPTIGQASRLGVEDLLQVCLDQVETVIVPAFNQFLK
jgi:hypothetical protein